MVHIRLQQSTSVMHEFTVFGIFSETRRIIMWEIFQRHVPIYCIGFCSFGIGTDEIRKWNIRPNGALAVWNGVRAKNTTQRCTRIWHLMLFIACWMWISGTMTYSKHEENRRRQNFSSPSVWSHSFITLWSSFLCSFCAKKHALLVRLLFQFQMNY